MEFETELARARIAKRVQRRPEVLRSRQLKLATADRPSGDAEMALHVPRGRSEPGDALAQQGALQGQMHTNGLPRGAERQPEGARAP